MYFRFRWILVAVTLVGSMLLLPLMMIGEILEVTTNPSPVILGYATIFTIVTDPADNPDSLTFQYQCAQPSPWGGPWGIIPVPPDNTDNGSIVYMEGLVGAMNVYGAETQQFIMGACNPPQTVTSTQMISFNVAGPDTETITKGLNRQSSMGADSVSMSNEVDFSIFVGAVPLGPFWAGRVQERITRPYLAPQPPPSLFDSGWADALAGSFYWDQNLKAIVDMKMTATDYVGFSGAALGATFDDFIQQNRIIILDCAGNEKIFAFPQHHFRKFKSSAATWQLVEDTP
jgi:hypothetical protein